MNGAKIYVGNLSWNTNDETLEAVFSQYGNVLDKIVMRDRETGRSRGFGFVTYATQQEAEFAIETAKQGIDLDGRQLKVNFANARGAGGAPGGMGGMYPQGGGFGGAPMGGYGGFPATGYGGAGAQYGGFGGYQPPQGNTGGFAGGFNPQGPTGYGTPPNQFPPNQGGYPGGGY